MDKETIQNTVRKRIEELTQQLNHHNYQYYVLDQPEISNFEYDTLMKELILHEKQFPDLKRADSPTQRVGGAVLEGFSEVVHKTVKLSLGNVFDENDIQDFGNRVRKALEENVEYIVELKIDGLTVVLNYEQGIFVRGATRGDGVLWGISNLYKNIINRLNRNVVLCY